MTEYSVVADHLAGLELIGKPAAAVTVHKGVLLGLGQEHINIFIDGVRFLIIEQFFEIVLHLRLKGGNIDEAAVAQVEVVPIVLPVIVHLGFLVDGAVLFGELGHVDFLIRLLHRGGRR